ncbi:TPA: Dabb family protein [Serratia marcescens]
MSEELMRKNETIDVAHFTASDYHPGLLKHIVLFKYKNGVTQAEKDAVAARFLSLKRTIRQKEISPYILSIVEGPQNSSEGLSRGFEHGFIVTFKSEGDRNFYVGKPIVTMPGYYDETHEEFKRFVRPLLNDDNGVLVFDFSLN